MNSETEGVNSSLKTGQIRRISWDKAVWFYKRVEGGYYPTMFYADIEDVVIIIGFEKEKNVYTKDGSEFCSILTKDGIKHSLSIFLDSYSVLL